MKWQYGLNLILFAAIWYVSAHFIAWDRLLVEEFFRVGWDKYEGRSINAPENVYFNILFIATIYSLWCSILMITKHKSQRIGAVGLVIAVCSVLCAFVLWMADGGFNLRESRLFWQFCCLSNIIFSIIVIIIPKKQSPSNFKKDGKI